MKIRILSILLIIIVFFTVGCNDNKNNYNKFENINKKDKLNKEIDSVKIIINEKEYIIELENNETTKSLVNILPQELNMSDLNGNEKYVYLNNKLPVNSISPKRIISGDVMLYGDNCLVIFYKSFSTSFSYTKIGHINNLPNLGSKNVNVKIEKFLKDNLK